MTKLDELPTEQKRYIQTAMEKMGADPWLVSEVDIDRMLGNYSPPESAFERERRWNEFRSGELRERAENAEPLPLVREADVKDFAKKYGVLPAHVRTQEMADAERLAAEQLEQFTVASEAKDTYDLVRIGNDRDHPHWESARRKVAEYFPSFDVWV